jgi:hypothetical protein
MSHVKSGLKKSTPSRARGCPGGRAPANIVDGLVHNRGHNRSRFLYTIYHEIADNPTRHCTQSITTLRADHYDIAYNPSRHCEQTATTLRTIEHGTVYGRSRHCAQSMATLRIMGVGIAPSCRRTLYAIPTIDNLGPLKIIRLFLRNYVHISVMQYNGIMNC